MKACYRGYLSIGGCRAFKWEGESIGSAIWRGTRELPGIILLFPSIKAVTAIRVLEPARLAFKTFIAGKDENITAVLPQRIQPRWKQNRQGLISRLISHACLPEEESRGYLIIVIRGELSVFGHSDLTSCSCFSPCRGRLAGPHLICVVHGIRAFFMSEGFCLALGLRCAECLESVSSLSFESNHRDVEEIWGICLPPEDNREIPLSPLYFLRQKHFPN